MSKTLLEKIDIVLKKYNNGEDNNLSIYMKAVIQQKYYKYLDNSMVVNERGVYYNIEELIGTCILNNNPDLFE